MGTTTVIHAGDIVRYRVSQGDRRRAYWRGKVLNVSVPSWGGERMLLVEAAGEHIELLETEVTLTAKGQR